jgi:hypothetical protein
LDYFCSIKIIEILKETEKESKNIFGMYSSQRMKVLNKTLFFCFFYFIIFRIGEQFFPIMKRIQFILVSF